MPDTAPTIEESRDACVVVRRVNSGVTLGALKPMPRLDRTVAPGRFAVL